MVSIRTFNVMYDHILFYGCKSPHQTSFQRVNECSAWWLQVAMLIIGDLCGYVWVNTLTLSPLRIRDVKVTQGEYIQLNKGNKKEKFQHTSIFYPLKWLAIALPMIIKHLPDHAKGKLIIIRSFQFLCYKFCCHNKGHTKVSSEAKGSNWLLF